MQGTPFPFLYLIYNATSWYVYNKDGSIIVDNLYAVSIHIKTSLLSDGAVPYPFQKNVLLIDQPITLIACEFSK